MMRGIYTAEGKNAVVSLREQRSLHNGLLGGMCKEARNKVLQNLNLDPTWFPDGPVTRFQHERLYVTCHAQWCEDGIVTCEVERQLVLVASGQVSAGATSFF